MRCLNSRASVPKSPTARASSRTMVSSSEPLTLWFSWVTLTASTTNIAEPVTQAEMATTVARFMLRPWSLVLTTVVMTRAIAPIGCTTVKRAVTRATAFIAIPTQSSSSPNTQRGLRDQPQQSVGAQARPPVSALTALPWRWAPKARQKAPSTASMTASQTISGRRRRAPEVCLPLPMMAQK